MNFYCALIQVPKQFSLPSAHADNSQMHYYQPEPTVETHRLDGLREVQTTPDLPCLKQVSFLMLGISHTPPHSCLAAASQMLEVWSLINC